MDALLFIRNQSKLSINLGSDSHHIQGLQLSSYLENINDDINFLNDIIISAMIKKDKLILDKELGNEHRKINFF